MNLTVGQVLFDRYEVLAPIGRGGMAEIFLAATRGAQGFRKRCVIKKILPEYANHQRFRAMFTAEAKLAALLEHPNLVQTIELQEQGDELFIIMEHIAGISLAKLLSRCAQRAEQIPLAEALYIMTELSKGLVYAHEKRDQAGRPLGLIHRDISPANVLISFEGVVKLSDFGIAKARFIPSLTNKGDVKGKLSYMAPETVAGDSIDQRSDIWSLGVVLWELLSNRRLFSTADPGAMEQIFHGQVRPLSAQRPDLPPALLAVVEQMLTRDREQRFQHAEAMLRALQSVAQNAQVHLWPMGLQRFLAARFANEMTQLQELAKRFDLVPTGPGQDQKDPSNKNSEQAGSSGADPREAATLPANPAAFSRAALPDDDSAPPSPTLGVVLEPTEDQRIIKRAGDPGELAGPVASEDPSPPAPQRSAVLQRPRRQSHVLGLSLGLLGALGIFAALILFVDGPKGLDPINPVVQTKAPSDAAAPEAGSLDSTVAGAMQAKDTGSASADASRSDLRPAAAAQPDAQLSDAAQPQAVPTQAPPASPAAQAKPAAASTAKPIPAPKKPRAKTSKARAKKRMARRATLLLTIVPRGEVQIDGQSQGNSVSSLRVKLAPGQHKITVFSQETLRSARYNLTLRPGKTRKLRIYLNARR